MAWDKLKIYWKIFRNMGVRYTLFRAGYEWKRRSGLLKKSFPVQPTFKQFITLAQWRQNTPVYFFESREALPPIPTDKEVLNAQAKAILKGNITFFNATTYALGCSYDWVTNPQSGTRYDISKHWTEIPDMDALLGDIKYVWEKSRFSYLPIIARYDHANGTNHAAFVFEEIESWMAANPINCGPNYRCSQEISLRIMNWVFLLYFYKYDPELNEECFDQMQHFIYWQLKHVWSNINFSRIAVRNNHAITEVLMLYMAGLLFPYFPEAEKWKKAGKKWFEEEIAWQVFEDGTYLQYSMNYHRVVVQLLTRAIVLSKLHNEALAPVVYQRAAASLRFLSHCLDEHTGELPNYGANDGALFFNWSTSAYRDFRPMLNALHFALFGKVLYHKESKLLEETYWLRPQSTPFETATPQHKAHFQYYPQGGYAVYNNNYIVAFLRTGRHLRRPGQADSHHFDLRVKGVNVLRDIGSFQYNTVDELKMLFSGTAGHNVFMLPNEEQMAKGPRFTWLNWTKQLALQQDVNDVTGEIKIISTIDAYSHLQSDASYTRSLTITDNGRQIIIEDYLHPFEDREKWLNWHIHPDIEQYINLTVQDSLGETLLPHVEDSYFSNSYGEKTPSKRWIFKTQQARVKTIITVL
jgi:hypothetical protein